MIFFYPFNFTEENPHFKKREGVIYVSENDSDAYEMSHDEPQFPSDLFQKFLYAEVKFNSNDNLPRKCEELCFLRHYVPIIPDFPFPAKQCNLFFTHFQRSTCYIGSFNYTYGLPGASPMLPSESQEKIEFDGPIRAINRNMLEPFDFEKWIPENLPELDGTCHGQQVIKVDNPYQFTKEFTIDASTENCKLFIYNPFFRSGKMVLSAESTEAVNCYRFGNDECSRILSVTIGPHQMRPPSDWRATDPLTYQWDSCQSTLLKHEWTTPVATIKYNRGVCEIEKSTFKVQFVPNKP